MTSLYEVLFIVPTNISEEDFSELSNKLRETIEKKQDTIGYCILKERELAAGLKTVMLMDIMINNKANVEYALKHLRFWATQKGYLGVLYLNNSLIEKGITGICLNPFKKFNFLVKGSSIHRQSDIEKSKFNFYLGDLDFL